ncbi:HtaA domain-containing protein [Arthrobacter livingstonensis]|nr:HtaA domain-containing protein [Arthrobacter livingstonensis]
MKLSSQDHAAFDTTNGVVWLRWRINIGFDDYVRCQTGDGTVTTSGGAFRDVDGSYVFPLTEAPEQPEGTMAFLGEVSFRAYMGVLAVRIAKPTLTLVDGVLELSIIDDAAPAGTRMVLATATPGNLGSVVLDPRLTDRGSELFFSKYKVGSSLAPIHLHVASSDADPAGEDWE